MTHTTRRSTRPLAYSRADKLKDAVVGMAIYLLVIALATYLHHVASMGAR